LPRQLQLAQLNVLPSACGAVATLPPSSLQKLQSALTPNVSSSPSWPPELGAIFLKSALFKERGWCFIAEQFSCSPPKVTVDYDKLELAEFVCGFLRVL